MKITTAVSIAFAAAPALAIPPPEFGFIDSGNDTELSVALTYNGNTTLIQEAMPLGGNITSQQPALAVNPAKWQSINNYTGQYLVLMLDPDAPDPSTPTERFILHWLAPNITQSTTSSATSPLVGRSLTNSTPNLVPFKAPAPPTNSSAHRYIMYAFQQPENFTIPTAFSGFSAQNRSNFNLTDFIADAGLARPAAGEYFYVSKEQSVPGNFIAAPGGTYPGGNGDAIFVGSSTASSSSSSSASSSSATATASGASSAGGSSGGSAGSGAAGSGASSSSVAPSSAMVPVGLAGLLGVGVLGLAAFALNLKESVTGGK